MTFRSSVESAVLESMAAFANALQRPVRELRRVWDLDVESSSLIAEHGGLPVGTNGQSLVAGPVLARSLDLVDAVNELVQSMQERRAEQPSDLDIGGLLASLLGLDGIVPSKSNGKASKDAVLLKRLFSPLGPACVLITRRQFDEARDVLQRIETGDWIDEDMEAPSPLHILEEFVRTREDRRWYQDQWKQMVIECDLQESRGLVAQVPMEVAAVRNVWQHALDRARTWDCEDKVREEIAETGVGRGETLFRPRTKVERMGDSTDKRTNLQRREEAIQVMDLAWEVTGSPTVQGPLAENLNRMSVKAFDRDDRDQSLSLLMHSLKVKPNSPLTCS
nr:hypothetical protein [Planctomycetota bacterium]